MFVVKFSNLRGNLNSLKLEFLFIQCHFTESILLYLWPYNYYNCCWHLLTDLAIYYQKSKWVVQNIFNCTTVFLEGELVTYKLVKSLLAILKFLKEQNLHCSLSIYLFPGLSVLIFFGFVCYSDIKAAFCHQYFCHHLQIISAIKQV